MSSHWVPDELAFTAEQNVIVKVVPSFTYNKEIKLLSDVCKPFRADRAAKVPLWLASYLYTSNMCQIVPPKWMNVSTLRKCISAERENEITLQTMPEYYMEVAFAFFLKFPNSVPDSEQVRSLVEDIWELRVEKIRKLISQHLQTSQTSEILDQMSFEKATRMEIHMFRVPLTKITELLTELYSQPSINDFDQF